MHPQIKHLIRFTCSLAPRLSPAVWYTRQIGECVSLTFDDGPCDHGTAEVLDTLKAYGTPATFFLLGTEVERFPELVRRMIEEGHEIGIHGYDHSGQNFVEQVGQCVELLKPFGIDTRVVRIPNCEIQTMTMLRLRLAGYTTLCNSFDMHDSMRYEGKWPVEDGPDFESLRGGEIILLHDDNPVCVEELPLLLEVLKRKKLQAVTVGRMIGRVR